MLIERHISAGLHDDDIQIDQIKLRVLFNYLYEAFIHAGSNILELYTDLLFVEPGSQPTHPTMDTNKNVKMTYNGTSNNFHSLQVLIDHFSLTEV